MEQAISTGEVLAGTLVASGKVLPSDLARFNKIARFPLNAKPIWSNRAVDASSKDGKPSAFLYKETF